MNNSQISSNMKIQVLRELYTLPIDIKIKIFQMSITNNMKEWKNEHRNLFSSLSYDIIWINKICKINTYVGNIANMPLSINLKNKVLLLNQARSNGDGEWLHDHVRTGQIDKIIEIFQ